MFDFLGQLEQLLPYVKLFALVIGVSAVVCALAAVAFILKSVFGPLIAVLQWLFGYRPGQRPGDIPAGLSHGLRLMTWSVLVGIVLWWFIA
jgi:hypothetical protein